MTRSTTSTKAAGKSGRRDVAVPRLYIEYFVIGTKRVAVYLRFLAFFAGAGFFLSCGFFLGAGLAGFFGFVFLGPGSLFFRWSRCFPSATSLPPRLSVTVLC